jgi:GTP pyrophosphokinase
VLQNGQTVEVITAPSGRPNPLWLSFVVTAKARSNIRHYLKNLKQEEALHLGRRLLDKALAAHHQSIDQIGPRKINKLLEKLGMDSLDTLLESIGLGNQMAQLIAGRLIKKKRKKPGHTEKNGTTKPLAIKGTEGMVVNFGKCCHPIPGDPIVGIMSGGRGLVIHRENCRNVGGYRDSPEKWVQVLWSDDPNSEFTAAIRVQSANQRGVLAILAAKISDKGSNIEHISFAQHDGSTTTMTFLLTAKNRKHLARIMRIVRNTPEVYRVARARG